MQPKTSKAEIRAFEKTFWERMPDVIQAAKTLHAVMGVPPGARMTSHETAPSGHIPVRPPPIKRPLPPELGGEGGLPGISFSASDHDTETDSDIDAEHEIEDEPMRDPRKTQQEVPTILVQPPSAGPEVPSRSMAALPSNRKRRPSELPRPQSRYAHKRQRVEPEVIDLTHSPVKGALKKALDAVLTIPQYSIMSKLTSPSPVDSHPAIDTTLAPPTAGHPNSNASQPG
ncbi:hypothetical protein B0A55_04218 [Friedmanniomyces simplex]|uniref:Uncharacterized protein n=1 Tax=Friedmanniomyces simplex TaxID=329884 RepID=A0A4U0XUM7_9PEZI|nr:hypothetical protein B0A55_04218 [Friedmanniomyces simplex]